MKSLDDYRELVGDKVIGEIYRKARGLQGKSIVHVNSTFMGGGVAEILDSLVPLMNDVGIEADWRTLHGTPDFFTITKKFHNALQGDPINLTAIKKQLYVQTNEAFCSYCHIDDDCVIVHDSQPLPIIKFCKKTQELWEYLKSFILRYDMVILSNEPYKKEDLHVEQRIIYPSIDHLSLKNLELSEKDIFKYVNKAGIPIDKPVITQVSRMDPWKDPLGLLEVFKLVKEKVDCRLVYCYDSALDDPEGAGVLDMVQRKAGKLVEKKDVIFVVGNNDILVNAIQRFSTVVVQKSIREGFCLAVTEALWKEKPVVATNVGGIPLQVIDGENGFLVEPRDTKAFADRIIQVLRNPKMAKEVGKKGREIVRGKFLITRALIDYLDLLNYVIR